MKFRIGFYYGISFLFAIEMKEDTTYFQTANEIRITREIINMYLEYLYGKFTEEDVIKTTDTVIWDILTEYQKKETRHYKPFELKLKLVPTGNTSGINAAYASAVMRGLHPTHYNEKFKMEYAKPDYTPVLCMYNNYEMKDLKVLYSVDLQTKLLTMSFGKAEWLRELFIHMSAPGFFFKIPDAKTGNIIPDTTQRIMYFSDMEEMQEWIDKVDIVI